MPVPIASGFTQQFHQTTNPEITERLQVIGKVKQALERTIAIAETEFDKAIGLSTPALKDLQSNTNNLYSGQAAADAALRTRDFEVTN